jgi:hypothetical protein
MAALSIALSLILPNEQSPGQLKRSVRVADRHLRRRPEFRQRSSIDGTVPTAAVSRSRQHAAAPLRAGSPPHHEAPPVTTPDRFVPEERCSRAGAPVGEDTTMVWGVSDASGIALDDPATPTVVPNARRRLRRMPLASRSWEAFDPRNLR